MCLCFQNKAIGKQTKSIYIWRVGGSRVKGTKNELRFLYKTKMRKYYLTFSQIWNNWKKKRFLWLTLLFSFKFRTVKCFI